MTMILRGFLGEMGAGNNTDCITAIQGALCSMQQTDVWLGMLWWAAGPWWGDVSAFSYPFPLFDTELTHDE